MDKEPATNRDLVWVIIFITFVTAILVVSMKAYQWHFDERLDRIEGKLK